MARDDHFSAITSLLLKYETGDFLLLSDLSDALSALKDFFLEVPAACKLIENLKNCVTGETKNSGTDGFTESLSAGIDLLQGYALAQDDATRAEAELAMGAFSCKSKSCPSVEDAGVP
ncbi:MAG TPA: hypothetical protein PL077_07875, partial [Treponemataceae bacterium]|nr:hypothetical protein [Treponemataceae bacterium]